MKTMGIVDPRNSPRRLGAGLVANGEQKRAKNNPPEKGGHRCFLLAVLANPDKGHSACRILRRSGRVAVRSAGL